MRVKAVRSIAEARDQSAKELQISVSGATLENEGIERLKGALNIAKGGRCPVVISYQRPEGKCRIRLGEDWRILPNDELLLRLRDECGANNVVINYD